MSTSCSVSDNGSLNSTTAVEDSQLYWDNLDIHEELELENDDDPTALDPARRVEWTRGELFIWLDMCFQFSRKIKETFLLPGDEQGPEIESFVEKALSLGVPPQIDEVMDVIVAGDRSLIPETLFKIAYRVLNHVTSPWVMQYLGSERGVGMKNWAQGVILLGYQAEDWLDNWNGLILDPFGAPTLNIMGLLQ